MSSVGSSGRWRCAVSAAPRSRALRSSNGHLEVDVKGLVSTTLKVDIAATNAGVATIRVEVRYRGRRYRRAVAVAPPSPSSPRRVAIRNTPPPHRHTTTPPSPSPPPPLPPLTRPPQSPLIPKLPFKNDANTVAQTKTKSGGKTSEWSVVTNLGDGSVFYTNTAKGISSFERPAGL